MHLNGLLVSLASLTLVKGETVLGVYIFHRHGDRTPKTYAPVNMTSLGAEQCFDSGSYYRNRYVASDASTPIFGLSHDIALPHQMTVTAPVDTNLQNSAQVFLQGSIHYQQNELCDPVMFVGKKSSDDFFYHFSPQIYSCSQ